MDPHDGTSAFLAGERGSAVSIALLCDGVPVLGVVHSPLSADRGPDTIAWAEGLDHLLRNGVPIAPVLADATLSKGAIVFVSQAAPEWPVGNARAVAPARFVALPSIAYRSYHVLGRGWTSPIPSRLHHDGGGVYDGVGDRFASGKVL